MANDQVVIDRIQTAGPGSLNVPVETIYELGNYQSLAQIRDTPDLSFSVESFDVSTEFERMLVAAYAGRSVADGVATAADATVTSATAVFTAADVGRAILVEGAGVAGADHLSVITSINSATSVEIADVAVTTVAGADLDIYQYTFDPTNARPLDMKSVFKGGLTATNPYDTEASVGLPFLALEQISYRFGLRDNARQTATLRGDSIYYNPGSTYVEETAGSGVAAQAIPTANPAYGVTEGGIFRRVLNVTAGTDRLVFGIDYTESYGAVSGGAAVTTITLVAAVPVTTDVRIMYSSPTVESYPANVHGAVSAIRPAAIRGRDIAVYLDGYSAATPYTNRLKGVQAVTVDWRVTLQKDEEFGNYHVIAQDYDVPSVNGTVQVKPDSPTALVALQQRIAGVIVATESAPATAAPVLEFDVVLTSPDDGSVLKRIHVEDARFTVSGFSGRVQQKLDTTINWASDTGSLIVSDF